MKAEGLRGLLVMLKKKAGIRHSVFLLSGLSVCGSKCARDTSFLPEAQAKFENWVIQCTGKVTRSKHLSVRPHIQFSGKNYLEDEHFYFQCSRMFMKIFVTQEGTKEEDRSGENKGTFQFSFGADKKDGDNHFSRTCCNRTRGDGLN